ncbi:MAG: hypothetical protein ACON3Z_15570 [Bradymonadia bacterium]
MRAFILATIALALITVDAAACLPEPTGWTYRAHRADYAGDSGAATIVFIGHAYGGFRSEALDELVTVHLSDGDQDIAGELTVSPADQALVWTASEPIEADRPYTLTFSSGASDYRPAHTEELTVEWPEAAIRVGQVNLRDPSPHSYVTDVLGDCKPDGPMDSCGGCERIVERTETHWSVEAAVEIGRNHNQFILGRVAIGTDEASAEDKLETARFRLLAVEDAAYLRANGGKLADWVGARGCLAVEVIKADGTPIIADSKCFDMPGANDRDPGGERPDLETDVVEIGGCDTMAGSATNSATWLTTMALLIGLIRRRR